MLILISKGSNALVTESREFYKINDVSVEVFGNNFKTSKDLAISDAKMKAIIELKYYTNTPVDIFFNNTELESAVASFSISEESFEDNAYKAKINFIIDKPIFIGLKKEKMSLNTKSLTYSGQTYVQIKSDKLSNTWGSISRFLYKHKISFSIELITKSTMDITIKNPKDMLKLSSEAITLGMSIEQISENNAIILDES